MLIEPKTNKQEKIHTWPAPAFGRNREHPGSTTQWLPLEAAAKAAQPLRTLSPAEASPDGRWAVREDGQRTTSLRAEREAMENSGDLPKGQDEGDPSRPTKELTLPSARLVLGPSRT